MCVFVPHRAVESGEFSQLLSNSHFSELLIITDSEEEKHVQSPNPIFSADITFSFALKLAPEHSCYRGEVKMW